MTRLTLNYMTPHDTKLSEALTKLLDNEYIELAANRVAFFRVFTGDLNIIPKDNNMTKEQKASAIEKHLKMLDDRIRTIEKTIRAISSFSKSLTDSKFTPKVKKPTTTNS